MSSNLAVIVHLEIDEARLEEFESIIKEDAVGSREREEGGCLRFGNAYMHTQM